MLGGNSLDAGRDLVGDDPVRLIIKRRINGQPVGFISLLVVVAMPGVIDEQVGIGREFAPVSRERGDDLRACGIDEQACLKAVGLAQQAFDLARVRFGGLEFRQRSVSVVADHERVVFACGCADS